MSTNAVPSLEPDCGRCFGLCCVALPMTRSADFPVDKAAGDPCRNLTGDDRCAIHDRLRAEGWKGCAAYDCFGAGQQVSQVTFGGVSWRAAPDTAGAMFAVLPVMRQVHEVLALLDEALALDGPDATLRAGLGRAHREVLALTAAAPDALLEVDLPGLRERVGPLLARASASARARVRTDGLGPPDPRARPGADLIAADLRRADLRGADLLGADLRDSDLRGADLTGALFLTRPQLAAARR